MSIERINDQDKANRIKPIKRENAPEPIAQPPETVKMRNLQQQVGNRAVQRLINEPCNDCPDEPAANLQARVERAQSQPVQRFGAGGPAELDNETADRINNQRGGGAPLDSGMQAQMGAATGHDFSGVQVHTSPEADVLNRQLGAKAFTTGQDIFFRDGAYQPHSGSGQELLAHELTHVVQQSAGVVGDGGNKMTVNAPGDAFEQEADAVSKQVSSMPMTAGAGAGVQRASLDEDEDSLQRAPEEEEMQPTATLNPEEEEMNPSVQREPEEEEMNPGVQRQAGEQEEENQVS